MRKSFYAFAAVAALTVMGLCAEKANAQYYYAAPAYSYAYVPNTYYVPSYSYGYYPSYGYSSYYPSSYSYGYSNYYRPYGVSAYYGRGYGYPYYGGYGRGYSGYSVGIGPFSYSNYRYYGGRRWR